MTDRPTRATAGLRTATRPQLAESANTRQATPLLLTVEEAAARLGVGRTTMFALIRDGQVASVRVGRLRRITPAALSAYVEQLAS